MSQGAFRELITRLSLSAGALTAVGVAIDAKVTGNSLEPEIQLHVDGCSMRSEPAMRSRNSARRSCGPCRRRYVDGFERMAALLRRQGFDDRSLRTVLEQGGAHHETDWARRLPDALRFLLRGERA